ncbi:FkbM family methyltransferase [Streptomyces sp. NPDC006739]|uniref:FkbM family methyltransferase n=1 Tax=Streptomyces sp. NPDC006739 TaxID=3364763 RepID=UPI0036896E39
MATEPTPSFKESRRAGVISRVARMLPDSVLSHVYGFPSIQRLVKRQLAHDGIPTRCELPVVSGALAGVYLDLRLPQDAPIWLGVYERWVQKSLLKAILPGGVVWDVGAFAGNHTLLMASAVGSNGRVYAFEPDTDNRARLATTIHRNSLGGNITVLPYAVLGRSGPADIDASDPRPACRRVVPMAGGPVPAYSLDSLAGMFGPPDLVKIDVEGAEYDLLKSGGKNLLSSVKPKLLIECDRESQVSITALLRDNGYRVTARPRGSDYRDRRDGLTGPRHLIASVAEGDAVTASLG